MKMNKLEQERKKNRVLYRELFYHADKTFKEQLNKLKENFSCTNCGVCCQMRYSELSPSEIYQFSQEGDALSLEYSKIFIPYGADKNFKYEKNCKISLEVNNNHAKQTTLNYVSDILLKSPVPVYFYFCKTFDKDKNCTAKEQNSLCSRFPDSVTTILPEQCVYKNWQKLCLDKIKNEIEPELQTKISQILTYKNEFSCKRTGTCCRLACSEYSYEQLKQKAAAGDNFAQEFTSIFVQYETLEEASKIFPDYVELVIDTLDSDEKIYFYHCPHVTDDNVCTIYEKRPGICKSFPDNPLSILPPICGYFPWKEETMVASMTLHAMTYIYNFYYDKIFSA